MKDGEWGKMPPGQRLSLHADAAADNDDDIDGNGDGDRGSGGGDKDNGNDTYTTITFPRLTSVKHGISIFKMKNIP